MDVVRVSNSININDQQLQSQQPQQLQTPQLQSSGITKGTNSSTTPRNGLNHQQYSTPPVAPGSSTGSLGSEGLLLHQASASSDSGNSSCVSGSGGGGTAPDDPETKNASFGSSASAGEVTGVGVGNNGIGSNAEEDEEEDERQSLLLKKPKKKATIYVNKVYDEGIGLGGTARGSSTETDDREDPEEERDVKPLLVENEKRKPKSIVKSPSNLSFGGKDSSGVGQRPRLNLQFQLPVETVIDDRPVHHVQFSKQQDNGYCYGAQDQQTLGATTKTDPAVCGSPVGSILSRTSGGSSTSSSGSSSNENSSLGGYAEARPPDGGWGWVVCFASFMVNLIADGVTFSFGVLYVELLDYFGEGRGKTAWVGSLFMAMPLLSGPIASFLTDRYGCRNVTIVGSILASLGFALSAYANTIEMLYATITTAAT